MTEERHYQQRKDLTLTASHLVGEIDIIYTVLFRLFDLLLYVHSKHLWSCRDSQFPNQTVLG